MKREIAIQVKCNDAISYPADVLILKYAQTNYGLDKAVTDILLEGGRQDSLMQPKPGEFRLIESVSGIAANFVLFVGVLSIYEFGYRGIRDFSRRSLSALAGSNSNIESVIFTLHGAGYGLDEYEAFESEIAGIIDAIQRLDFPSSLREIAILESDVGRARRLQQLLVDLVPNLRIPTTNSVYAQQKSEATERLRAAGYTSNSKDHAFVAMPFREEMEDVYHYGIQSAVRASGFLCERADLSSFTGNVMEWVRHRIKSSKLVIADLTDANPNVYLEVGYAWGCGIPTVLLVNGTEHLKFDVRDQRCLSYKKIKDLEESLKDELNRLKENGDI